MGRSKIILHICPREEWGKAQQLGEYRGDRFATRGFIHCSTPDQITAVANYLFRGRRNLVLLEIDSKRVQSEIRYEDAGNNERYPHIYGPLNLDAVTAVQELVPNETGMFEKIVARHK